MEIERKYIPKTLPENLAQYKHHKIEQAYLNNRSCRSNQEAR
ncbi:MAG: hypothetical protein ACLUR5_00525 [Eubacterium ventriosum]